MSNKNPKNAGRPTDYPKDLKLKKLQRTIPDVCTNEVNQAIDQIVKPFKNERKC